MADNPVLPATGVAVAGDDIAGIVYQRVKINTGLDGVAGGDVGPLNPIDVRIGDATNTASVKAASTAVVAADKPLAVGLHPTSPLPAGSNTIGTVLLGADPDTVGTGNITAADAVVGAPAGTGALLSGASTAGSLVALSCPGGDSAWNVQVTGTFGGTTLYYEASLDSTNGTDGNWINVNGRQTGVVNTVLSGSTAVAGVFRGNTSGIKWFRVRAVGGAAINVAVIIRHSAGVGAIFLNASIPAGSNAIGTVAAPTITKGTQGATGFTTQDLKDAGRVMVSITASAVATATAEALISMIAYRDLVAGAAATTFAVTAGKRFRIQKIQVTCRATSTVNNSGIVRLRMLAGTVLVGSPVHDSIGVSAGQITPVVAGTAQSHTIGYPDGLELSGTMQLGLTQLFTANTSTLDVHITGYEY